MIEEEIKQLKGNDTIILAHYYVDYEIQKIADYVGDSFYLAKIAKKTDAKNIIFAGVNFMGESAKILNPDKHVYMPDLSADCPMAHMVTIEEIEQKRKEYSDLAVVCYINSTAEIKTYSDVCVTSSNALKIVNQLPNHNIFFIPDSNLGNYVKSQVNDKNIILCHGYCPRHHIFNKSDVLKAKELYPDALFVAHPECKSEVLEYADYIGSTSGIIDYITHSEHQEFIVGTVDGIFDSIIDHFPDKKLYRLQPNQICPNMKKNSLEKILNVLKNHTNEIIVDELVANQALKPLNRMLELGK